jgi:pSer/pThr/pTyr-binding forkhead associated (FHA) protein
MAYLQIESGELGGRRFEISEQPLTIGRGADNQIVLNDTAISTNHCHLVQEGEVCRLVDLDSTNGTLLNDSPVTDSELRNGDIIILGSVILSFRSGEMPAEAPAVEAVQEEEVTETAESEPEPNESLVSEPTAASTFVFKPRRRQNAVALPVIIIVLICVVAAGVYFLRHLLS